MQVPPKAASEEPRMIPVEEPVDRSTPVAAPDDPHHFRLNDPINFKGLEVRELKFPHVLKAKHVRRLGAGPDGFTVEVALKLAADMCAVPDEALGEMSARDAATVYMRMTGFLLNAGFLRTS